MWIPRREYNELVEAKEKQKEKPGPILTFEVHVGLRRFSIACHTWKASGDEVNFFLDNHSVLWLRGVTEIKRIKP